VSITTYPEFLEELNRLISGDEDAYSSVPARTLARIVDMGQRKVYRDTKSRHNNKAYAVTVTSNLAAIPADFQSNDTLHFGGFPLMPKAEDEVRSLLQNGYSGAASGFFAQAGGSFIFAPAIADGTAVQGRYFYRLPDLTVSNISTNALFLAETDLFLFACLSEAAPFFGDDKRAPMWAAKYASIKDRINSDHNNAAFSAGRIARSPSTTILR